MCNVVIHCKFNQWQQMNNSVKSYLAKMESYREGLGDEIGDRQFVQCVWSGLNDNISSRLYDYGLHPDWSTYIDLVHTAIQAERAVNNIIHHNGISTANTQNYLTYFGPKYQSKHLAKHLRYFARYLSSKYLR
jgi:hypothetical protein